MVVIDRRLGLELERFEYSRVGAGSGVARLTLALDESQPPLDGPQLVIDSASGTPRLAPAGACRTERRLDGDVTGSSSQLLWRGVFALPQGVIEDPSATFVLQLDGRGTLVLPPPLPRSVSLPELELDPTCEPSRTGRGGRVATLTAVATLAASLPLATSATALAQTTTTTTTTATTATTSATATTTASTTPAATTATATTTTIATTPTAPPAPVVTTTRTQGAARLPTTKVTKLGSSRAASKTATSSSTCPSTKIQSAGVSGAQSTSTTTKARALTTRCASSTRPHFDVHHTRPASGATHHPTLAGAPPATSIGTRPSTKQTAAERRKAARRRAAARKRSAARRRAAARQADARRRQAAARRAAILRASEARAAHRRHEAAALRRALATQRRELASRARAAAIQRARARAAATTSISPFPGFSGPSSWTGIVASNPALSATLGNLSGLVSDADRPPSFLVPIYMEAARRYHVPWQVLAAINEIESDYGRDISTSSAGAIGWMQFEPGTWKEYGVAVDGASEPNPYDPRDAIFAAARYLRASGGDHDIRGAVFAYNHADWYVDEVMARAEAIASHAQYERASVSRRGEVSVDFATDVKAHPEVRYSGGVLSRFDRLIAAANMVSAADFPYLWGGGHEQPSRFGPFDCSGSVSYVMQQAGYRLPTTVAANVGRWHLPAGPGRVTIFYNDVHTFMRIGNRFFGTSGFARPGGGAGWFDVGRLPVSYLSTFHEVHVPRLGLDSFSSTGVLPLGPSPQALRRQRAATQRQSALAQARAVERGLTAARQARVARRQLALQQMLGWLVTRGEQLLHVGS